MSKKVYLIKGALVDTEGKKEWIESITASKERANKIKAQLNRSLEDEIIVSKEIFDKYTKEGSEELEWGKMEFHTDNMTDDEFEKFCIYRYGTKMPFKIEVSDLV
jgi:hypothetical protein